MHYGRLVCDLIAWITFGLRPNFGLKLWSKARYTQPYYGHVTRPYYTAV